MLRLLLFPVFICFFPSSDAEFFTSIADMEPLLETRRKVIHNLDVYIKKEEQRILLLKRHLILYQQDHHKSMEDVSNYLGNPIHAFTLIKSLTTNLDFIEDIIKNGTEYVKSKDVKYPTLEDLTGAAQALTRLQETYRLNVHELAEGMLNGVKYGTAMSVSECFDLGLALCKEKDFKNAHSWMTEAYKKINEAKWDSANLKTEMDIEYIHNSSDTSKTATERIFKLLEIYLHNDKSLRNAIGACYKNIIKDKETQKENEEEEPITDQDWKENWPISIEGKSNHTPNVTYRKYQTLCRGEMEISPKLSKRLKCWYTTRNQPFLKYAPVKVEQSYIKPDIFVFYEVLSNNEIELLKLMAKPKIKRALYHNSKTGKGVTGSYRIGKVAWLSDEDSPVVARISQRVADMTGLDLVTSENLQVFNYGIGGHYAPHCDFARKNKPSFYTSAARNRIATVLFYMSDVAQGGATVFTELGLTLYPINGAAAFWWNLHPSGEGDVATRHAACPVLRGSKWVANKWIHEVGQEFIKPCDLDYQEEGFSRRLPRPVPRFR